MIKQSALDKHEDKVPIHNGNTLLKYSPNGKGGNRITVISDDGNIHDLEECIKELKEYLGMAQ